MAYSFKRVIDITLKEGFCVLSKPCHGWSRIDINSFSGRLSYLVDVPFVWLNSCLFSLKHHTPLSLYMDEEGSDCIIVSYDTTTIIVNREETSYIEFNNLNYVQLAEAVLHDIKKDVDAWVDFTYDDNSSRGEGREKRKAALLELITIVGQTLVEIK